MRNPYRINITTWKKVAKKCVKVRPIARIKSNKLNVCRSEVVTKQFLHVRDEDSRLLWRKFAVGVLYVLYVLVQDKRLNAFDIEFYVKLMYSNLHFF